MISWQIGDVKITRAVELEIPIPYNEAMPFIPEATPEALAEISWLKPHFVNEKGDLIISIHALLVETPTKKLLVDTCIGNDKPNAMTLGLPLQTEFLSALESIGWARETVDVVACTHLHIDHVGWNTMKDADHWIPTFPNAEYLIGKKEYEFWQQSEFAPQQTIMEQSIAPIMDAGLVQLVEMDHQICPEVRLRPTPGHTPGHVSIAIESKGEKALITGDFIHHPSQIARPHWAFQYDTDQTAATDMREQLLAELNNSSTLVIGTHFTTPTAGFIKSGNEEMHFDISEQPID